MSKLILDEKLKSHFLNLYAMALTDTQIDATELEMLFKMGQERGIAKEEIQHIILYPDQVHFSIPKDTLVKMEYLYDFARMAWANGDIDEYEEVALKKFCLKFGFEKENAGQITQYLIEEAQKGTEKSVLLEEVKNNL